MCFEMHGATPGALRKQMAEAAKKILCIENDRETAKLAANELSRRGFCALVAYDARIGLAAILKRIPDLVLCAVGMPEISGLEMLETVNGATGRFNRIPFIFLTGWTDREHELRGRSLGADYVAKPIDFDILEEIIRARLVRGVVRHEIAPKVPASQGREIRQRLRRRDADERIVELIDAPTVDLHRQGTEAVAASDEGQGLLKGVTGRIVDNA
jgi:DNA-binding response OmpR family regulator